MRDYLMMKRVVGAALGMMIVAIPVAGQQAGTKIDPAVFEQGRQTYEDNCADCHQSGGGGIPPDFPALSGNDRLGDLSLIVTNIHRGKGAMPAFADMTAAQIAALAAYVRNAWKNEFGGVTTEEVTASLGGLADVGTQMSVWDGVYTTDQAARGAKVHSAVCAKCHGVRGDGAGEPDQPSAPAIARATFLRKWDGQTLAGLYEYVRTTMPPDNPGSRSDQEYIDAVAQMLALTKIPVGEKELVPDSDALSGFLIGPKP